MEFQSKNIGTKKKETHFVFCHRRPERSFFWRGKQFPICARCTGIHAGYLSFPIFLFSLITLNFWWSIALILPTYIDGVTQALWKRESTNFIRVTTGLAAGIGSMSLVSVVGKYIGDQILLLLN